MASNRGQRCWGRRSHFPFTGLLRTDEIERWILWVPQWLMWPVFLFPGQAQQPSDSRYLLFLWQLDKRCACWPVHSTWRFCWPLPGYYYYHYYYYYYYFEDTVISWYRKPVAVIGHQWQWVADLASWGPLFNIPEGCACCCLYWCWWRRHCTEFLHAAVAEDERLRRVQSTTSQEVADFEAVDETVSTVPEVE